MREILFCFILLQCFGCSSAAGVGEFSFEFPRRISIINRSALAHNQLAFPNGNVDRLMKRFSIAKIVIKTQLRLNLRRFLSSCTWFSDDCAMIQRVRGKGFKIKINFTRSLWKYLENRLKCTPSVMWSGQVSIKFFDSSSKQSKEELDTHRGARSSQKNCHNNCQKRLNHFALSVPSAALRIPPNLN